MSTQNQPDCMSEVFASEGGYVDHPRDPGGATNKGITLGTLIAHRGRSTSKSELRAVTNVEATAIYGLHYWGPLNCDLLPDGFDYAAFDAGVNSGNSRGAKWLQRALGLKADGRIGPVSLAAADEATDGVAVIQAACAIRMGFLSGPRHWGTFGKGWSRRVAHVEAVSCRMWLSRTGQPATARLEQEGLRAAKASTAQTRLARAAAATGSAGGAGAASAAAVPVETLAFLLVTVAAVAMVLWLKARHNRNRAEAYRQVAASG
jgi:lysozyme family protein